jgi:hypothetical protein
MEIESLSHTVKKALENFDAQNIKYDKFIFNQNVKFDELSNEITWFFDEDDSSKTFNYEHIGYFDNQVNIWLWSWLLSDLKMDVTSLSRELLQYGLILEPGTNSYEHFMIKALLVNSRIQIDELIQLEVNLAIYASLVRDKIKFIYPRKRYIDNTKTKYVTFFYFIK